MGYASGYTGNSHGTDNVPVMIKAIEESLHNSLAKINERVHVLYASFPTLPSGASIYTSYFFRMAPGADETQSRWQALKAAASREIVKNGGTISHQHGVGHGIIFLTWRPKKVNSAWQ